MQNYNIPKIWDSLAWGLEPQAQQSSKQRLVTAQGERNVNPLAVSMFIRRKFNYAPASSHHNVSSSSSKSSATTDQCLRIKGKSCESWESSGMSTSQGLGHHEGTSSQRILPHKALGF